MEYLWLALPAVRYRAAPQPMQVVFFWLLFVPQLAHFLASGAMVVGMKAQVRM